MSSKRIANHQAAEGDGDNGRCPGAAAAAESDADDDDEEEDVMGNEPPPLPLGGANGAASGVNADDRQHLTERHILFGRGKGVSQHPGNRRMRQILDRYRAVYQASQRGGKCLIVKQAYEELLQGGATFLKRENGEWVEVDGQAAMEKVGHSLRCTKHRRVSDEAKRKSADTTQETKSATFGPPFPFKTTGEVNHSSTAAAVSSSSGFGFQSQVGRVGMVPLWYPTPTPAMPGRGFSHQMAYGTRATEPMLYPPPMPPNPIIPLQQYAAYSMPQMMTTMATAATATNPHVWLHPTRLAGEDPSAGATSRPLGPPASPSSSLSSSTSSEREPKPQNQVQYPSRQKIIEDAVDRFLKSRKSQEKSPPGGTDQQF